MQTIVLFLTCRKAVFTSLAALGTCAALCCMTLPCVGQTVPDGSSPAPTKGALIGTLKAVLPLLQQRNYASAAQFFVVPPSFRPEMLDGLLRSQEVSLEGILRLEQEAEFGPAVKVFGEERAKHFADRASVDVSSCYGFNYEAGGQTGEVMAVWEGTRFKLVRLDDVGKLPAPDGQSAVVNASPETMADELPALQEAVEADPDDVGARARYAMALFKLGNLPAAWSQLREARRTQPDHEGLGEGVLSVLTAFERKGLFIVGTPMETIEAVLGPPDEKVDLASRERWIYVFMGIDFHAGRVHEVVDLRGATESLYHPTEIVSVQLDGRGWTCGYRKKMKGSTVAYYYLPQESLADWTEQVEVERILGAASTGTMEEIHQTLLQQVSERHPGARAKVLGQDDRSLIVAFALPAQPGFEKRHQLVRLMKGPVDLHRLAYTIKVDEPSKETQITWLGIVKSASLNKVKAEDGTSPTDEESP